MLNFRAALVAIVPSFEAVQLPWRSGEAYDQWDAVSEMLFKVLVLDAINWSTNGGAVMPMPRYGFSYADYSSLGFIGCRDSELDGSDYLAFIEFENDTPRFTHANFARIDQAGHLLDRHHLKPVDETDFKFYQRLPVGGLTEYSEVSIDS